MARPNTSKRIGRYSNDFKVKAVRLTFIKGTQIQEIAKGLDIHPFMLSRWRKEYRDGKLNADRRVKKVVDTKFETKIREFRKLETENARLLMENDLLKKAIRFSSKRRKIASNL